MLTSCGCGFPAFCPPIQSQRGITANAIRELKSDFGPTLTTRKPPKSSALEGQADGVQKVRDAAGLRKSPGAMAGAL
jgi:hypothetical protein